MKIHPDKTGGVVLDAREQELLGVFQLAVLEDGMETDEAVHYLTPIMNGVDPKFRQWLIQGTVETLPQ